MSIVIWPPVGDDWIAGIREPAGSTKVVTPATEAEALAAAPEAEMWIGQFTPQILAAAPKLKCLQWTSVSLERVLFPELARSDVAVMNMRHLWDDHISNHVLALFLALCRDFPRLIRAQIAGKWSPKPEVAPLVRDPSGMTVLIVGVGGIGAEAAYRLSVLGVKVVGVDPMVTEPPRGVISVAKPEKLAELLPTAGAVIICAPQTPQTIGMFDEAMFRKMRKDAFFINIGRGKIVKLAALEKALVEGWIAGAGVDVFETEPLPASSALWKMDNVIVTPHVAGTGNPHTPARRLATIVENVRRFTVGQPYANVVDKTAWR